jgi:hypothetical protein
MTSLRLEFFGTTRSRSPQPLIRIFSGAEAVVSPSHRSRDFFGSFLDPAKNERRSAGISIDIQDESPFPEETVTHTSCG